MNLAKLDFVSRATSPRLPFDIDANQLLSSSQPQFFLWLLRFVEKAAFGEAEAFFFFWGKVTRRPEKK